MQEYRLFSSKAAAKSAGVSIMFVNRWISRNLWNDKNGHDGFTRPNKGRERKFTFAAIMQLAIAVQAAKNGIPVNTALMQAYKFCYFGSPYATYSKDPDLIGLRPIGCLFPEGKTVLICRGDYLDYDIVNLTKGELNIDEIAGLFPERSEPCSAFTLVDINEIWFRVCRILKYAPETILKRGDL